MCSVGFHRKHRDDRRSLCMGCLCFDQRIMQMMEQVRSVSPITRYDPPFASETFTPISVQCYSPFAVKRHQDLAACHETEPSVSPQ